MEEDKRAVPREAFDLNSRGEIILHPVSAWTFAVKSGMLVLKFWYGSGPDSGPTGPEAQERTVQVALPAQLALGVADILNKSAQALLATPGESPQDQD